jgi:DHA1 family tetracycline resistance protein-like MFS transporter
MAAQRHQILFIVMTILIDAIGVGLILPVLPRLLMTVGGIALPQAIAIGSWMGLATAIASFIGAPVIGNMSDALGRRTVLLVALGGLVLDYLLLATAPTLTLIFVGRILSGLFGGSYGAAQASIADITEPKDRARNFGMVGAAFGVGFVLGPAIGGLLTTLSPRAPFYAACGLALLNFLYGLFLFPDTLKLENRRPFTIARANPLGAWRVLRGDSQKDGPGMTGIALVLLLWQLATLVYPLTWSFYGIAQLHWTDRQIGISLAVVGVVIAVSQSTITGRVVRRLGERDAASLGMIGAASGYLAYAFITSTWMAYLLMLTIIAQALVQPSLLAMLSRRATPQTQGEVQGIAAMTMGVGSIIGPLALTRPMAFFSGGGAPVHFPGVAFLIAAVVAVIAMLVLRRLPKAS